MHWTMRLALLHRTPSRVFLLQNRQLFAIARCRDAYQTVTLWLWLALMDSEFISPWRQSLSYSIGLFLQFFPYVSWYIFTVYFSTGRNSVIMWHLALSKDVAMLLQIVNTFLAVMCQGQLETTVVDAGLQPSFRVLGVEFPW